VLFASEVLSSKDDEMRSTYFKAAAFKANTNANYSEELHRAMSKTTVDAKILSRGAPGPDPALSLDELVAYEVAFRQRIEAASAQEVDVLLLIESYDAIDANAGNLGDDRAQTLNSLGRIYERGMSLIYGLKHIRDSSGAQKTKFGTFNLDRLDAETRDWETKMSELLEAAERCAAARSVKEGSCNGERWLALEKTMPYLPNPVQESSVSSRSLAHVFVGATSAGQSLVIDGEGGYFARHAEMPRGWDTGTFYRTNRVSGATESGLLHRGSVIPPNTDVYYFHGDMLTGDNNDFAVFRVSLIDPVFPDEYGISPSDLKRSAVAGVCN
jgi:hypothetical protein